MAYAEISDLALVGIRAEALAPISSTAKQASLDAAAEQMDSYFRARYELPDETPGWQRFEFWGQDVVRCNAILAVWDLMTVRGYNPASGADEILRMRYEDAIKWLEGVSAQKVHPNLKPKMHESPGYNQPSVTTATRRGW